MVYSNILITGASGFLGRHLVKFFKEKDFKVTCHVRTTTAYKRYENLFTDCQVLIGDIADNKFINVLFTNHFDYVIHAAACKYIDACEQFPLQCMESNFYGTFNILKKAHETCVKRLVFISTDKAEKPTGMYGYSKLMGEWMTMSYGYDVYRGVNFWASDGSFIDKWSKAIRDGGEVTLNDSSHVRYFRFIEDVLNDIYEIIQRPDDNGRIFEPSEVMEVPIADVYNKLKQLYPDTKFNMGQAHYTEKKYEDISPHILIKQVPVEKLLNNSLPQFICN